MCFVHQVRDHDEEETFCVVESGTYEAHLKEVGAAPVRHYRRGDTFGELGLVSCPFRMFFP